MASDKRTGPLLRVASSCIGCDHLIPGSRTPPQCLAMAGRMMPTTTPAPTWCPELPAARLALARGIVAEAERADEQAREERIAKRSVFRLGEPR